MTKFLVLNGPNINALGRRDIGIYGAMTLDDVNREVSQLADKLGGRSLSSSPTWKGTWLIASKSILGPSKGSSLIPVL